MRTAELEKKPASLPSIPPATTAAEIKSILFHVGADDDAESRLQAALSIARAFSAHLNLLHVTPIEAYAVVDAYGTFVNTDLIATLESDAVQLKSRLERSLANEDVSWDYEEITGSLMDRLVRGASLADLLVCGRDLGDRGFGGSALALLGDLLRLVRTPLLILGDDRREIDLFGPALVAWNGSVEAANAVSTLR